MFSCWKFTWDKSSDHLPASWHSADLKTKRKRKHIDIRRGGSERGGSSEVMSRRHFISDLMFVPSPRLLCFSVNLCHNVNFAEKLHWQNSNHKWKNTFAIQNLIHITFCFVKLFHQANWEHKHICVLSNTWLHWLNLLDTNILNIDLVQNNTFFSL